VSTTPHDPSLLVGLDEPDDAAVYRVTSDVALVQTVDFFTPIVDDPRSWGRIAAANSLSDVYAMGGRPITALNLVGWPRSLEFEVLGAVLEGGDEVCHEAGVAIVGGHSVDDPEPKYGLAVTGVIHPEKVVRKRGGRAGDVLVLTKPLGTGIISSAIKEGNANEDAVAEATRSMTRLNRSAAEAMVAMGATAATDVTGFGFVGHLLQMLGDDLAAEIDVRAIPLFAEAVELARAGVIPGGSRRNHEGGRSRFRSDGLDDATVAVLFDAQTSGGLLIAVPPDRSAELIDRLHEGGDDRSAAVGVLRDGAGEIVAG